jgi:hypothetical protein
MGMDNLRIGEIITTDVSRDAIHVAPMTDEDRLWIRNTIVLDAIHARLVEIRSLPMDDPILVTPSHEDARSTIPAGSDPAFVLGRTWAMLDALIAEVDAARREQR